MFTVVIYLKNSNNKNETETKEFSKEEIIPINSILLEKPPFID